MRYFVIFVAVVLMIVGAGQVMAKTVTTTGAQMHVVLSAAKPIGSTSKAVFCGQYLKTPRTGGEVYFATAGLRQSLAQNTWVQPLVGFVGGWFPKQDGLAIATMGGTKVGPIYLGLDFERYSAGGSHRTKFWYHTADLKFGKKVGAGPEWTAGIHFNKVDRSERFGVHLANQLTPHVKLEGRVYRMLYGDNPIQYFRVTLVVS